MDSNELAGQLHDRATRGESLSVEEQSVLTEWYTLQDKAESAALGLTEDSVDTATLHTQVETTLTQITVVTQRIQSIISENEALKRDISHLRQQLVYQPAMQLT